MTSFCTGFVALVGRPNVGKSTLLNALLGDRIAIVTPKPQTTRTRLHGIINTASSQVILTDTPGLTHSQQANRALMRVMRRTSRSTAMDSDVVVLLIDAPQFSKERGVLSPEDLELARSAAKSKAPLIVALNKTDALHAKEALLPLIASITEAIAPQCILPISAKQGDGLDVLLTKVTTLLPEGVPLFPTDQHTDSAERFLCAELVREQILLQTHQEVPHSTTVVIEDFEDGRGHPSGNDLVRLLGRIIVERESQKPILIGKRGARIRCVSEKARHEIELLLGCKVYLRLQVRVDPEWTRRPDAVKRYGLDMGS